jgi:excisionase family DNA binding protein
VNDLNVLRGEAEALIYMLDGSNQDMLSKVSENSNVQHESSVRNDDLATVKEIAEFLQLPTSWIYERSRRRGIERIPHFKLGKYLRFSKSEVWQWIESQRANSLAPR